MFYMLGNEKQNESQEGCDISMNSLMIVEMIANKKDPVWFNHIIIIGECYAGLLFLDCYGRVFEWNNSMCGILWPLGDYLNEAPKVSLTHRIM
ncbi:hypothetical protein GLOIN_2v1883854 [Rhizophagus clarus]|nr:hypothetical protein GLOIN_2v1883854 [Rhizophagus clarus]